MTKPMPQSPGLHLIAHVIANMRGDTRDMDWAEREAIQLAIRGGLRFELGDLANLFVTEEHYALAVKAHNLSFCQAYEQRQGRRPYVFGGRRLHVGAPVVWKDLTYAQVTSFDPGGESLIVCGYPTADRRATVNRRVRVTLKEIRAAERARKEENKAAQAREILRDRLRYLSLDIPVAVVATWSAAEVAEATSWASLPDHWQWSLPPKTPPPAFVQAAAAAAEAESRRYAVALRVAGGWYNGQLSLRVPQRVVDTWTDVEVEQVKHWLDDNGASSMPPCLLKLEDESRLGRCLSHEDCANHPELGRSCLGGRTDICSPRDRAREACEEKARARAALFASPIAPPRSLCHPSWEQIWKGPSPSLRLDHDGEPVDDEDDALEPRYDDEDELMDGLIREALNDDDDGLDWLARETEAR